MRILFIANHLNVGGISSYLFTLATGLIEKGHIVYLASSGGQLVEKFKACGIKHIIVPLATKKEISPKIIFSFLKLRKEIKKNNIDLIHSNSRTTQVLGGLLSRYLHKPHIFTCHGFFKPKLSRLLFGCWPKSVIAISFEVKQHLICDFKLDEKKITVINNGIDTKVFGDFSARDKMRKILGIDNVFVLGNIGRLSDVKGQIYLIRAMQKAMAKFPSSKLLIIGEGKMEQLLAKEVANLDIKSNVLFVPQARGSADMLSTMDIFVMPSLQEGLGLALMEAMAQGLAVIGSSVGGIKTLIQDKVNGLLVEPKDTQGLAAAITLLLGDHQLRRNLGINARKFIINNFSKEKMVDATETAYKQCLSSNSHNKK